MMCVNGEGQETMINSSLGISQLPVTDQELEFVEDMLTKEFNDMSIGEREKVLFDIHGISDDYDPSNVNDLLDIVDGELDKIRKKPAYDLAKKLNPEYVADRGFLRMFLRSERFDPKRSAKRIVEHFEIKRSLFGSAEVLGRDIRWSDLSEKDKEILNTGNFQVLPRRDAAGRVVMYMAPNKKDINALKELTRCMLYMMMRVLQDEETQKRGIVFLVNNTGKNGVKEEFNLMRRAHQVRLAIPDRIVAGHYCYSDPSLRPYIAGIKLLLRRDERTRFRTHFGNYSEVIFQLQTYGIDTSVIPIAEDGTVSLSWHQEWIRIQREKEEYKLALSDSSPADCDLIPRRFDVLFGRGKKIREHTGNLRCVHVVEMYKQQYEEANKYQKTEIAERIVSIIHESNGRFLKWDSKIGWVQVDNDIAREKISHFFRHNRSKSLISSSSSTSDGDESPNENDNKTSSKSRSKRGSQLSTSSIGYKPTKRPSKILSKQTVRMVQ